MGTGLKVFLWIFHIILVAGIGYGAYHYYGELKDLKDSKIKLEADLAATNTNVNTNANTNAIANTNSSSTCATLTAAEIKIVADWKSYTNSTYDYTIKYPNDWTLTESSADNVTFAGTDSGERVSMQIKAGERAVAGFSEYTIGSTKTVNVGCEASTQTTYNGDESLVLLVNNFTHSGTKFLPMFSYKNVGASYASDMEDINNIMLKTFTF